MFIRCYSLFSIQARSGYSLSLFIAILPPRFDQKHSVAGDVFPLETHENDVRTFIAISICLFERKPYKYASG